MAALNGWCTPVDLTMTPPSMRVEHVGSAHTRFDFMLKMHPSTVSLSQIPDKGNLATTSVLNIYMGVTRNGSQCAPNAHKMPLYDDLTSSQPFSLSPIPS